MFFESSPVTNPGAAVGGYSRSLVFVAFTFVVAAAFGVAGCGQPTAKAPSLDACKEMPLFQNERTSDALPILLRFENNMGPFFAATDMCISIDGHSVLQEMPRSVVDAFAVHKPVEVRTFLRPGVIHQIGVATQFAGRGAARGYGFSVVSGHGVKTAELQSGTIVGQFTEVGGPAAPLNERPAVEWSTGNRSQDAGTTAP